MRSPRTISEVRDLGGDAVAPDRRFGLADDGEASRGSSWPASSWMMPMPVLAMITKPKRLSWIGATNSMITQSTPMIALNRVKTLARTISAMERLLRTGTSLTSPRATRSATSAAVRPRARPGASRPGGGGVHRIEFGARVDVRHGFDGTCGFAAFTRRVRQRSDLGRTGEGRDGAVAYYSLRAPLPVYRSCGLSGGESVQSRAPNGPGRAGPRRSRPRVATRVLCVVRAREASAAGGR